MPLAGAHPLPRRETSRVGEDRIMPTYITLIDWTDQGIEHVEESPDRLDQAKSLIESMDGEMTDFFLTMGGYDLVTVTEFPDDDTAAKALLRIGKEGNVSTETLRAWPEDEYRELLGDLS